MQRYFLAGAAAMLCWPTILSAQDAIFKSSATTAHLIELYSSEGCSSCPPAEAWINRLENNPSLWKDIFPVVFHVDYWDGLGWPDRFARTEFTQRQRDYAARLHQESVYTPEFVVDGREWRRGWLGGDALPATAPAKSGDLMFTAHEDGKFSATYITTSSLRRPVLNIALVGMHVIVDVKRGENGGRQLEHDFVVLGFTTIPLTTQDDKTFQAVIESIKTSTDDPAAAVITWVSDDSGVVRQFAGGWLSKNLRAGR